VSTWEDRMAAAATARREAAEAERRRFEEENDPHRDHHGHIAGTLSVCSCGEVGGLVCVALPAELDGLEPDEARAWWLENVRCGICGERGVWSTGGGED